MWKVKISAATGVFIAVALRSALLFHLGLVCNHTKKITMCCSHSCHQESQRFAATSVCSKLQSSKYLCWKYKESFVHQCIQYICQYMSQNIYFRIFVWFLFGVHWLVLSPLWCICRFSLCQHGFPPATPLPLDNSSTSSWVLWWI